MRKEIFQQNISNKVPDKRNAAIWVEALFNWLFLNNHYCTYEDFLTKEEDLKKQLHELLCDVLPVNSANAVVEQLFQSMDTIYFQSEKDSEAILNFDPAAQSKAEIIAAYPGFFAVFNYRISHLLWLNKVPIIPRLISEYVHGKTGIDIHPGAKIGESFIIDHGTGVVIGETAIIGNQVKIYQGVTLGALSVRKDKAQKKRHPTIGDNVIIYSNATILGGDTIIGNDTIIGGNVWLTSSVPAQSLVYHKSEIIVKGNSDFPEPIHFVI